MGIMIVTTGALFMKAERETTGIIILNKAMLLLFGRPQILAKIASSRHLSPKFQPPPQTELGEKEIRFEGSW